MAFVPRNNEIHSRHPTCALGDCASAPPIPIQNRARKLQFNCEWTVSGIEWPPWLSFSWLASCAGMEVCCAVLAAPKLQAFHSFLDPFTNPHPQVNNTPHGHFNGKLWGRLIFNEKHNNFNDKNLCIWDCCLPGIDRLDLLPLPRVVIVIVVCLSACLTTIKWNCGSAHSPPNCSGNPLGET